VVEATDKSRTFQLINHLTYIMPVFFLWTMCKRHILSNNACHCGASGAVVEPPSPMRKVLEFELCQGHRFSNSYEAPNYLELVNLMSVRQDDKLRSSVCKHSEHQARTIKIWQPLCISY
jgi:hypothetical protein